jgi:hypothetical protein
MLGWPHYVRILQVHRAIGIAPVAWSRVGPSGPVGALSFHSPQIEVLNAARKAKLRIFLAIHHRKMLGAGFSAFDPKQTWLTASGD